MTQSRYQPLLDQIAATLRSPEDFSTFFTALIEQAMPRLHGRVFWGDRMLTLDKSAGFMDDPRFRAAYERIRGSHVYDLYDSPHTIAWRLHTLVGRQSSIDGLFRVIIARKPGKNGFETSAIAVSLPVNRRLTAH